MNEAACYSAVIDGDLTRPILLITWPVPSFSVELRIPRSLVVNIQRRICVDLHLARASR